MKNVLIPPICNWSFLKQLPQQIATQFARNGYRVYFCNQTLLNRSMEEIEPNLFLCHNYQDLINDIKNKRLKIDILYNTWARNENWVDLVNPAITIYHSCDSFDEWKPYEKKMLDKSDIVLCTSAFIQRLREKEHDNVYLVRNAVDSSLLHNDYETVEEINKLPKPVFAFVGAIGVWVSTYLMKSVANKYTTVFVGAEFGKPCPSNVINLGVKSHSDLIHYYNSVDAFLLPFNTKSEITQAACPIKLYEYLSTGKPIISTSWEETEVFNTPEEKIIFTANDNDEFMKQVDYVANMTQQEKDILSAKSKLIVFNNTWEQRFSIIENAIQNIKK